MGARTWLFREAAQSDDGVILRVRMGLPATGGGSWARLSEIKVTAEQLLTWHNNARRRKQEPTRTVPKWRFQEAVDQVTDALDTAKVMAEANEHLIRENKQLRAELAQLKGEPVSEYDGPTGSD